VRPLPARSEPFWRGVRCVAPGTPIAGSGVRRAVPPGYRTTLRLVLKREGRTTGPMRGIPKRRLAVARMLLADTKLSRHAPKIQVPAARGV
jgi:hypothetical protein